MVLTTLTLGVGATASVSSVVYSFLFRPLPFPDGERLVMAVASQPERNAFFLAVSYQNFMDWKRSATTFSEMAAVTLTRSVILTGTEQPRHLDAELISGNYFEMLGVRPEIGRRFSAEDDRVPGGHPLAMMSHALWRNHFGGDPGVIGRQILLNDQSFTVIGVLPESYQGSRWDSIDLWVPIAMAGTLISPEFFDNRRLSWSTVLARLRPGATLEEAEREMNRIAEQLEVQHPLTNKGYRVHLLPLRELYYDLVDEGLWQGLIAAGFLLLLCCINVASLLLTRGREREQDLAVRSAMGAGRRRLFAEHLGESLILSLIGGTLGLILAAAATGWLVGQSTLAPKTFDGRFMDEKVILGVFVVVVLSGLLTGLWPAVRSAGADLWSSLRSGGRQTHQRSLRYLLDGLAVAELGLALVILVGAGAAVQKFLELRDGDLGFPKDGLLTLRLDLGSKRFEEDGALQRFADRLISDLRTLPGVEGAAMVGPFAPPDVRLSTDSVFEDRIAEGGEEPGLRLYRQYVTPGYFEVMGIPLREGREFSPGDSAQGPLVAIVAQPVVDRIWPGGSGIGKRMRRGLKESSEFFWMEIVGVVEKVKNRGTKDFGKGPDLGLDLYLPFHQDPTASPTLMVRFADGLPLSAAAIRETIHRIDPEVPVYQVGTMRDQLEASALDERFGGLLWSIFAGIAVIVAGIGVFGVLSYGVRRRTREIGVRVALGASRGQVLALVARQGLWQLLAGLVLGALFLFALQRGGWLPLTLGSSAAHILFRAVAFLLAMSFLAVALPAWRAARIVPTEALRDD